MDMLSLMFSVVMVKVPPKTVPFIPFSLQIAFNGFLVFLEEDRILLIFFCHNITFIYPSVYK